MEESIGKGIEAVPLGYRDIWFDGDAPTRTPIYRRESLFHGWSLIGPAVVEQLDTTTVAFPGDNIRLDHAGNLIVEI